MCTLYVIRLNDHTRTTKIIKRKSRKYDLDSSSNSTSVVFLLLAKKQSAIYLSLLTDCLYTYTYARIQSKTVWLVSIQLVWLLALKSHSKSWHVNNCIVSFKSQFKCALKAALSASHNKTLQHSTWRLSIRLLQLYDRASKLLTLSHAWQWIAHFTTLRKLMGAVRVRSYSIHSDEIETKM